MSIKSAGIGAPFRWLAQALALVRAHPGLTFGVGAPLMLFNLGLVQSLSVSAQSAGGARVGLQLVLWALVLVLLPPLNGAYYRLLHALHLGQPASRGDMFAAYRDVKLARRLILNNLTFLVLFVIVNIVGNRMVDPDVFAYMQTLSTLPPGTTSFPAMPNGTLPTLLGFGLVLLLFYVAKELATAQVALAGRDPLSAVGDGFKASLLNFGSLLLFVVPMAIIGFIGLMLVVLLAMVVAGVLRFVHPLLPLLVLVPLGIAVLSGIFVLAYAFVYHAWRETLGDDAAAPPALQHQIEA